MIRCLLLWISNIYHGDVKRISKFRDLNFCDLAPPFTRYIPGSRTRWEKRYNNQLIDPLKAISRSALAFATNFPVSWWSFCILFIYKVHGEWIKIDLKCHWTVKIHAFRCKSFIPTMHIDARIFVGNELVRIKISLYVRRSFPSYVARVTHFSGGERPCGWTCKNNVSKLA